MSEMRIMRQIKLRDSGFSLLEVLVAIVVVSLIGLAAVALLNARAAGLEDNATVREAQTSAEEALSAVTAGARNLPEGGSLVDLGDARIRTLPCDAQFCDFVLTPDLPASERTSPARGYAYPNNPVCSGRACAVVPPSGYQFAFVRRWRVDVVNSDYRLRKITVAILKDESSAQPIVLQETVVALEQ